MTDLPSLANGRACLIRMPGCKVFERVCLCHYSLATIHGMALKSPDTCGAWGCWFCHDVVDGRRFIVGWSKDRVRLAFADGCFRTLGALDDEGYKLTKGKT